MVAPIADAVSVAASVAQDAYYEAVAATQSSTYDDSIYEEDIVVTGKLIPASFNYISLPIFLQDAQNRHSERSYIRINGGMPAFPPTRVPGPGSGEFDSIEPELRDRRLKSQMGLKATAAWIAGYDDAAEHLQHYLGASGETIGVDIPGMIEEIPGFQDNIRESYRSNVISEVNATIAREYNGGTLEFAIVPKQWSSFSAPDGNWFLALGIFEYNFTSSVVVSPGSGGRLNVSITSNIHVYDRYDWNAGQVAPMPDGSMVLDNNMARLHRSGLARDFEIRGTLRVAPLNYQYNFRPPTARSNGS
jgi:hypothetical protein